MMAACLCGSYKNSVNLPPPFQGNLAHAIEGSKHPNKPALPYYTHVYALVTQTQLFAVAEEY